MRETIKNAWKIIEIRKKILYTLGLLLVYRLLCYIPTPGVDTTLIADAIEDFEGNKARMAAEVAEKDQKIQTEVGL